MAELAPAPRAPIEMLLFEAGETLRRLPRIPPHMAAERELLLERLSCAARRVQRNEPDLAESLLADAALALAEAYPGDELREEVRALLLAARDLVVALRRTPEPEPARGRWEEQAGIMG